MMIRQSQHKRRSLIISISSLILFVAVWFLITEVLDLVSPVILPGPGDTISRFLWLLDHSYMGANLIEHTWASLKIVMLSWVVALLVGTPLGVLMGWYGPVERLVNPLFQLLRPIPPIAWIPLSIVWFGIDAPARIFVVLMAAFPPVVLNAYEGVHSVDNVLVRAARTLGARDRTILFEVVVPSATPLLITGARIALGNAWMTMVAAELLAARIGVGYIMLVARRMMQPDIILSAMIIIGFLGAAFSYLLNFIGARLTPWQVDNGH